MENDLNKQENIVELLKENINGIKEKCIDNLLNSFISLDDDDKIKDKYGDCIGVYAIYLKEKNITCFDDFCEKFKNNKLLSIEQKLKDSKYNLIYIGKTCNSFNSRLFGATGHLQGGNTSLCGKLYKYKTGDKYGLDKIGKKGNEILIKWFNDYTYTEIFPVAKRKDRDNNFNKIIVTLIEELLINTYKPPLNKI